jgi:hypothetical protein
MRLDDVVELLALRSIPAPLVEAVMWAALGLGILLFIVLQQGLLHFSGAFSAHAFGLGAALFFFSRLIAFMAAGHEILAPAGASPHH